MLNKEKYKDISMQTKIANSFKYLDDFNNEEDTIKANESYELYYSQWKREEGDIRRLVEACYWANPKANEKTVLRAVKEVLNG